MRLLSSDITFVRIKRRHFGGRFRVRLQVRRWNRAIVRNVLCPFIQRNRKCPKRAVLKIVFKFVTLTLNGSSVFLLRIETEVVSETSVSC